ncbi:hypothetical protein ABIA31_004451 [Catenulispora sp. MAP5-51]
MSAGGAVVADGQAARPLGRRVAGLPGYWAPGSIGR